MRRLGRKAHVADTDLVERINESADRLRSSSDTGLRAAIAALRAQLAAGTDKPELLPTCFALTKESTRRTLGLSHFDVQLLAGLILARGAIAEMATGEGKTLAATLPTVWYALHGEGVHVMTVNAYLAGRDYQLLKPIYELLGLTVGLLQSGHENEQKRRAYQCDITYGVGTEFGFDYLRDQLVAMETPRSALGSAFTLAMRGGQNSAPTTLQPRRAVAIIDEVDSVLVDEARSALILAGSGAHAAANPEPYLQAHEQARALVEEVDFGIDPGRQAVALTEVGVEKISGSIPRVPLVRAWTGYVANALTAQQFYERDIHYIVGDDEIYIVDEYTGRKLIERAWTGGLQQAVQAVEGVTVTEETAARARITRQHFFELYATLSGMSGTAMECREEFATFYSTDVEPVPLRNADQRSIEQTRYFVDRDTKLRAVAETVAEVHKLRRPVLVGTRTVRDSEALATLLQGAGLTFRLLNARQDHEEAQTIKLAGQVGVITIATNMAGRGADIPLGDGVAALGGLHVIGVERHEAQRIDRQLIGRAARQGEPGSAQFFVCADDALLDHHAPALATRIAKAPANAAGELIAFGELEGEVDAAQRRAEQAHKYQRQALYNHDQEYNELLRRMGNY